MTRRVDQRDKGLRQFAVKGFVRIAVGFREAVRERDRPFDDYGERR